MTANFPEAEAPARLHSARASREEGPVQVRRVSRGRALNGECPQWDELRQRLYWVDMRAPKLHAYQPDSGRALSWEMPAWIGCYGLRRDGRIVVALRTGLQVFDPEDGSLSALAQAPYDARRFCFNDGGCDRGGRLIVGPMHHPLAGPDGNSVRDASAPLWSYDSIRGLVSLRLPPVRIANGLAFSPDGRTLYHSDTAAKTIWACDYDEVWGTVSNQRVFAMVEEGGKDGGPDGATVDREGFYLCAVFGAGCLLRFDPDGRLERRIPLPVRFPTMPALGGPDLSTLYVTSASYPSRGHAELHGTLDGCLLALGAPAPGLPTSYMDP
jgi:sugar lactone lactonase YvrE